MGAGVKFIVSALKGEFAEAMVEHYRPIAEAGSAAMRDAANDIKLRGRADIAAAGFGKRWQNTFRVDTYPKRGVSANAAALIYHRIPYADVFETGATIRGKPTLWVPLSSTPKKIGRKRMSAKNFRREIGPLQFIKGGRRPLLAARISVRSAKAKTPGRVTLAALRRGAIGGGPVRSVPLFVGVPSVTLRDRFSLREITRRAADSLPQLYLKHFQAD